MPTSQMMHRQFTYPKIRTNAKDGITEIDHTEALPKAKIIDTFSYSSLLPGKEYTVKRNLDEQRNRRSQSRLMERR